MRKPLSSDLRVVSAVILFALTVGWTPAAQQIFFGEDLNSSDIVPPASMANTTTAHNNFMAQLSSGVGIESFETFSTSATQPLNLSFPGSSGSIGATLTSPATLQIIRNTVPGTASNGRYPLSGVQFLQVNGTDFTLNFSSPIAAFGFYGADIGDYGGHLTLDVRYLTAGVVTLNVGNSATGGGATDGSALFFGFLNTSDTFDQIIFHNSDANDLFAYDAMTVGDLFQLLINENPVAPKSKRRTIEVVDVTAMTSAINSGLPMLMSTREALRFTGEAATRDLNSRLYRLRSGADLGGPEENQGAWSVYASGDLNGADWEARNGIPGAESETMGGTGGFEYRLSPGMNIGVAVTGLRNDTEIDQIGSVDVSGPSIAPYISMTMGKVYVDLLCGIGSYDLDLERRAGEGATARASTESLQQTAELNAGWNMEHGALQTGPFCALDYLHVKMDGYRETRAGNMNLDVPEQSFESLVGSLGWQASYEIKTRIGRVIPQIRAGYDREFMNDDESMSVSLQTSPIHYIRGSQTWSGEDFTATGHARAPGRDYMSAGAGVLWEPVADTGILLDYQAQLLRDGEQAYFVTLRLIQQL